MVTFYITTTSGNSRYFLFFSFLLFLFVSFSTLSHIYCIISHSYSSLNSMNNRKYMPTSLGCQIELKQSVDRKLTGKILINELLSFIK